MRVIPAAINAEGIEAIISFAEKPETIAMADEQEDLDQLYIPGISIPDVPGLEEPFNVPILGDNESISLTHSWPRKEPAGFDERLTFVGMLPAEPVVGDVAAYEARDIDDSELSPEDEKRDDLFDEVIGFWGGFLSAVVTITLYPDHSRKTGEAEFIVMESQAEFEGIQGMLDSGDFDAADVVSAIRFAQASERHAFLSQEPTSETFTARV